MNKSQFLNALKKISVGLLCCAGGSSVDHTPDMKLMINQIKNTDKLIRPHMGMIQIKFNPSNILPNWDIFCWS